MPYDPDDYPVDPASPPRVREKQPPHDATVSDVCELIEIAAILLTDEPDATFAEDQLTAEVLAMAGDELIVSEVALRAALRSCDAIERLSDDTYRLK